MKPPSSHGAADTGTRVSLLLRLRDLDDTTSWRAFFDRYWRLLYTVSRAAGLDDADAQDVVQESVIAVARQLPRFRYDSAKGTFKRWLLVIVRRRIADLRRRQYRQAAHGEIQLSHAPDLLEVESDESEAQDPSLDLEAVWDRTWEEEVLAAAVESVRATANPKHFQIFDYCVRQEWPASRVAAALQVSLPQVYLARHRLTKAVQAAARQINDDRLHGR